MSEAMVDPFVGGTSRLRQERNYFMRIDLQRIHELSNRAMGRDKNPF